ncbi:MAG: TonB-dependent receptor [Pseudomonadota bacterium]
MKAPLRAAVLAAFFSVPAISAHADDTTTEPTSLDPVIVTATRTPTPAAETLAAVTVIDREEIERAQATDVAELLRYTAGIDVARSGGPGSQTSVFIRGGESDHTLVLVDGIRVNPSTAGGAAVQNIAPEMIERIEIVKGPRSTLYGSDAIGGVINIITRTGGNGADISVRGGSENTREITGNVSYSDKGNSVSLYAQHTSTDGIPAFDTGGPDRAYRQSTINLKGGTHVGAVELSGRVWNTQGNAQYMGCFGSCEASQNFRNQVIEGAAAFKPTSNWESTLSLSRMTDDIEQTASTAFVRTTRPQADWHNVVSLGQANRFSFGLTAARENAESLSFDSSENLYTAFVQDEFNAGAHHALVAGSFGDYGSFGNRASWNAEYGYDLFKSTRLIASAGSGFHAPTADDRFGFGGNTELKPEEALNYELGLKQSIGKYQTLDLRVFRSDVKNLISVECISDCADWMLAVYQAVNVNRYRNEGVELSYNVAVAEWSGRITAISQNPIDRTTNATLLRRAKQSLTGQITRHFGKHYLAIDAVGNGETRDFGGVKVGAYGLLAVSGGYEINNHLSVQARVNNVLGKDYETVFGYNQPGTNGYLTLRFAF